MGAGGAEQGLLDISAMIRRAFPRNTVKLAALASGRSVETVRGWLYRGFTPSADTLLRMARKSDAMRREVLRAMGEGSSDAAMENVPPADRRDSSVVHRAAPEGLAEKVVRTAEALRARRLLTTPPHNTEGGQ